MGPGIFGCPCLHWYWLRGGCGAKVGLKPLFILNQVLEKQSHRKLKFTQINDEDHFVETEGQVRKLEGSVR